MLTEFEKQIIAFVQGDISITKQPYLEIAERLSISETVLLQKLKELCDRGVIRRFGATIRHQKSGFATNVMVAWKVKEDLMAAVGREMASFREVSHCYRRNPTPEWPYNLYTMIHAKDQPSCMQTVQKISAKTAVETYTLLFSRRELKKTSMKYFSKDVSVKQEPSSTADKGHTAGSNPF